MAAKGTKPKDNNTPKRPVGHPTKYKSLEELQSAIDKFFSECDSKNEPYTITGLALTLGLDRKALCLYSNKEEFGNAIKTAKLRVEQYAEKKIFTNNPTGAIFALKNFGWTDKTEVSSEVKGSIDINLKYE